MNTPPILASNFSDPSRYARGTGTATWESFEVLLGGLEGGQATAFSSGMAAITAVFDLLVGPSSVVIGSDCYHGVTQVAAAGARSGRWDLTRLDVADTTAWVDAVTWADLVWIESPTNPLLEIADLVTICGAGPRIGMVVVDNTFATPLNQRPLALGADISIHSVTKFLGGHSDLLMGAAVTDRPDLNIRLEKRRALGGAVPGALETFLATRGMRTLGLRLERSQVNALSLAARMQQDQRFVTVRYPGLIDDPGHSLAVEQLDGFGAVVAFDLIDADAAEHACRSTRLIRHATSLGGVESTMERRAAIAGQEHLPPGLIRLSVGIEDADDLWNDLDHAVE